MANTFKVITRDVAPATAGTPETIYTVQTGSTLVVQSIFLTNMHTAQVDVTLQLVSTTTQTNQTQNTTAHFLKDVPLPAKSSLELNKINMNEGDVLKVDASVADKVSVVMNYMEIT